MRRLRFALVLVVAAAFAISCAGWIAYVAKDTQTVTKTRVVKERFDGTPQGLANFLGVDGQQSQCPAGVTGTCVVFQAERFFVFSAFAPESGPVG